MSRQANIGVGIGLSGEKEFKQAIKDINKDLSVLSAEMKKTASAYAANKNSVEALTAKDEVLNKQLKTQEEKVNAVKKALENSKKQYGENDSKTKEWQRSLYNAEAELYKLDKELKDNKTALENAKNGADNFGDELKDIGENADKAGKKCFTMGDLIKGNLITAAIISGVRTLGRAFVDMAKSGIEFNAQIEQYQASFETMTGSAEKAAEITQKLKDIGAATPFEIADLAETTKLLMNYGLTADEAIEKMTMLGDISQGSSEKMNRIATAYGQMSSAGKVHLEDIKQMIEAGFNPLREISDTTGESMASLYNRISKGTISVDEITASMERSTSVGGKYFGSMEKQSKTLNGLLSTLRDTWQNKLGEAMTNVSGKLTDKIIPSIIKAVDNLNVQAIADNLARVAEVLGWVIDHSNILIPLLAGLVGGFVAFKVVEQITGFMKMFTLAEVAQTAVTEGATVATKGFNLAMRSNPIGIVCTAIGVLITIISLLVANWDKVTAAIKKAWEWLKKWNDTGVKNKDGKTVGAGELEFGVGNVATKYPDGYASGTRSATRGYHRIAENGFEIVTDPSIRYFSGGQEVYNHRESAAMLGSKTFYQTNNFLETKYTPYEISRQTRKATDNMLREVLV